MTWKLLLVFFAGLAAGFLNVTAGGGSLITMPVLIFLGLPSAVANGTNRIAILLQNLTSITAFRGKGYFEPRFSLTLAVPAVAGSLLGSRVAVELPDALFNRILAVVMIAVLILILVKPTKSLAEKEIALSRGRKIGLMVAFFFVGIYGGFIQGGVGFIIITVLSLFTGASLVRINSLKVFVVALYTVSALAVFFVHGKINLAAGLVLAAGNSLGGWAGTAFSVKKGDRWIKIILVVTIAAMTAKLLGLFELAGRLLQH
jgi:uncharacterized membrane protein YfcA